ncbi:SAM-dependent methyltransferase [Trebonia kvetii]|uniref:SAM-dependent methyltransferase n=1 Tax=Trebonia kvetii TaxID=2480626 RepID=UPI0034E0E219
MIDERQAGSAPRPDAARIDPEAPSPARVADFLNGGRNNFQADRWAARVMVATAPAIEAIVPAVLDFHRRARAFPRAGGGRQAVPRRRYRPSRRAGRP